MDEMVVQRMVPANIKHTRRMERDTGSIEHVVRGRCSGDDGVHMLRPQTTI